LISQGALRTAEDKHFDVRFNLTSIFRRTLNCCFTSKFMLIFQMLEGADAALFLFNLPIRQWWLAETYTASFWTVKTNVSSFMVLDMEQYFSELIKLTTCQYVLSKCLLYSFSEFLLFSNNILVEPKEKLPKNI